MISSMIVQHSTCSLRDQVVFFGISFFLLLIGEAMSESVLVHYWHPAR